MITLDQALAAWKTYINLDEEIESRHDYMLKAEDAQKQELIKVLQYIYNQIHRTGWEFKGTDDYDDFISLFSNPQKPGCELRLVVGEINCSEWNTINIDFFMYLYLDSFTDSEYQVQKQINFQQLSNFDYLRTTLEYMERKFHLKVVSLHQTLTSYLDAVEFKEVEKARKEH